MKETYLSSEIGITCIFICSVETFSSLKLTKTNEKTVTYLTYRNRHTVKHMAHTMEINVLIPRPFCSIV